MTAERAIAQSGMHWQPNLENAKRIAAQTNRLVLVHFWTESCGPCMRMEREVFSRPEVAAAIEANFVPVRINVQRLPQIAREYGVDRWPTDVILGPRGDIIDRKTGGADANQYVATLNQISARTRGPSNQAAPPQTATTPLFGQRPVMTGANRGNAAGYMPPSGVPDQRSANPPPKVPPSYSGVAQAPGTFPPPATSQTAPARPQPWQAEPGQWNTTTSGTMAGYAPAAPSVSAVPSMDRRFGQGGPADPGRQAMTAPAAAYGQASPALPGMAPPNPPVTDARSSNPPLALEGYCPVALSERERWVRGDPRYGVIHRGRTYLFTGPEEAKRFFADPDRYAPVLSGIDVVVAVEENRQVPGKREYGAWYEGRMYLFSSEASFRKFDQDPGRYSAAATQVAQASSRRPPGFSGPSAYDRGPMR